MKFNPWEAIFGSNGLMTKVTDKGKDGWRARGWVGWGGFLCVGV